MQDDYTPTKTCSQCKQELPATSKHFHRDKRNRDGFCGRCKDCISNYQRAYYKGNRESRLQYYYDNRERINEKSRQWKQINKDRVKAYQQKWRAENREQIAEQRRSYRRRNKKAIARYQKKWYTKNRTHVKQYWQENKTRFSKLAKLWRKNNPCKEKAKNQRYRARKRNLPDTFTSDQWLICLEYHNFCCAVCGNQLRDLFGEIEPHADHWIPIASNECLGTVIDNMICLCNKCNQSKGAKMPDEWLIEQYGKRKAQTILNRVHAYFEWALNNEVTE